MVFFLKCFVTLTLRLTIKLLNSYSKECRSTSVHDAHMDH